MLRYFPPTEYKGDTQIWDIVQDRAGMLYFAIFNTVVQYDGVNWRRLPIPTSIVRSLAVDPSGKMWVGGEGEFGWLEPDGQGDLHYTSLGPQIPKEHHAFADVWTTVITPQGIFFKSDARLFRWDGKRMQVWPTKSAFGVLAYVGGKVYVSQTAIGLEEVVGDELRPLPGGETYKAMRRLNVVPYDGKRVLTSSSTGLFHLYDGEKATPFATEIDDFARKNLYYSTTALPDGSFCVTTTAGGAAIIEHDGRLRRIIGANVGLPNLGIYRAFQDREGFLWLGLANGIARVEINSPMSIFSRQPVNSVIRYDGSIYATSSRAGSAVYKLVPNPDSGLSELIPVSTSGGQGWALLSFLDPEGKQPNQLIAGTFDGVFRVDGLKSTKLIPDLNEARPSVTSLLRPQRYPNRIIVGHHNGLSSIRWEHGKWIHEGRLPNVPDRVFALADGPDGSLWVGCGGGVILKVDVPDTGMANAKVQRFAGVDGANKNDFVAHTIAGEVFFAIQATPAKIYRWDAPTGKFVVDPRYLLPVTDPEGYPNLFPFENGDVWSENKSANEQRQGLFRGQADGKSRVDENPFRRLSPFQEVAVMREDNGLIWIAGPNGLVRFDSRDQSVVQHPFSTLVRKVASGDKTIFNGAGDTDGASIRLPYDNNSLRFEVSAPVYVDESQTNFRHILEGADRDWSQWRRQTEVSYSSLGSGSYRFRVQSRNVEGRLGDEAVYSFTIAAPWYRSTAAYVAYILLFLLLVVASSRYIVGQEREKARRETEALEATVAARTKEIRTQAAEIATQKESIQLLSDIGKEITASLDLDTILFKLYERVNQFVDATIFGVGLLNPSKGVIEYTLAIEDGQRFAPFSRSLSDPNQLAVWCITNRKPILINDVDTEYKNYIAQYTHVPRLLEDGTPAKAPSSMIYLPLIAQERVLGVLSIQSFKKNAYTTQHLDLLRNLASYTTIALDNADAYQQLKSAQEQLVVQEKLASLGALTAGIAHEIKNPLNFVNNFAEMSVDLTRELHAEFAKHRPHISSQDFENIEALLDDLSVNSKKVNEHGKRADAIVKSMLLHSRGQASEREPTDINAMLDEYTNLAYHGMRAQDSSFNITIQRKFGADVGKVDAVHQDLSRVFLNILNNACYAASDKAKKAGPGFVPILLVRTVNLGDMIEVGIRDNGMGIPAEVRDKIFHPFFTTKPTGQGTGLGLSISHDIVVQQHGGQLEVDTRPGEYTEFVVRLPRRSTKAG
jgi:signal transduction histidine kinase/ligand-binding sensor domain-containing protein